IISPNAEDNITYNRKITNLFEANIIKCPVSEVSDTIDSTLEELRSKGYNPYFIQGGGHGNIGTQAYINAYDEILDYEDDRDVKFDYVFHASGTGTTQAGLVCGHILNKDDKNIVGISVARKNPYGGKVVLDSVNDYL